MACSAVALASCVATPSGPPPGTTNSSSTIPSGDTATRHLSVEDVNNLTIPLGDGTSATLHNGVAKVSYGGASADTYHVAGFFAEGDLNADGRPDAAFVLADDSAGSGNFFHVVVALGTESGLKALPPVLLGDRVPVEKLAMTGSAATATFLDRGDETPMTSVDKRTVVTLAASGGTLRETSRKSEPLSSWPLPAPNPVADKVTATSSPTTVSRTLDYGQSQSFQFPASAGQQLRVTLDAPLGLFLSVRDLTGRQLTSSTDRITTYSGTVPATGTVVIDVASLNGSSSSFKLTFSLSDAKASTPAPKPAVVTTPPAPAKASGKVMYLTFDDGPNPPYTSQILKVLDKYNAKATFFVLGQQVQSYPSLVSAEVAAGHTLGNHTWDHQSLAGMSQAQFNKEVLETKRLLGSRGTSCLRPPYGARDSFTSRYAAQAGYSLQFWDIDTRDWSRPGVNKIVNTVVSQARPGAVVLMHDGGGNRTQSVAALDQILTKLTAQGWRFPALC